MKKILYPLFVVLALGLGFTACSDDDEEDGGRFATTPEIEAAGVYSGTFSKVQDGKTDTLYSKGTLTVAATDSAYCADITYDCSDGFTYNATSVANITHDNSGYAFWNSSTSNGLGTSFTGRIAGDGSVESTFDIKERSGRVVYTYHYKFVGNRQELYTEQ